MKNCLHIILLLLLGLLQNTHGTPYEAYDEKGEKVWACELDVYGKVRTFEGEKNFVPFRYQGQYEDEETGLYYNRFRYHSPDTGTFISQDPIGLAGNNPTLYGYVKDVNSWIDTLGLDSTFFTSSDGLTLEVKNVQDLSHLSDKEISDIYHANNNPKGRGKEDYLVIKNIFMKTKLIERINNYLNKSELFYPQQANDEEIEQAEIVLDVIFDSDYKQFIKTFGGCYVGIDIYGFKNSNDLEDKTVVDLTKLYKDAGWPIEKSCYVISIDSSGNPIMINKCGEVILFDHDNGCSVILANSFEELIEENLPD